MTFYLVYVDKVMKLLILSLIVQGLKEHEFNDYKNYYWWPHTDGGYNGIVYFNDDR